MGELTPMFDRNVECLLCKKTFTSKAIRSRFIKVASYDTDFFPHYAEGTVNGLLYNIFVCPHCGFSFSKEFSKYFAPGTKEAIIEKICSHWTPHSFSDERTIGEAIQTYMLASMCAILKKEKHITVAGIYLRIAWLYRLQQNDKQELRFMKLALHEYDESFSHGDYSGTQMSEVRILYMAGELSRRIADIPAATKYFSMVLERQKSTVETSIIQMARDRWAEIKGEKKVES
jgi:uncharacterized protein